MIVRRRRVKQTSELEVRLALQAEELRRQAELLPPGQLRDDVLLKARQAEAAARMSKWIRSPELRSLS
jgi:hypothetical protein